MNQWANLTNLAGYTDLQTYWKGILEATFANESEIVSHYRSLIHEPARHASICAQVTPWIEHLRANAHAGQTPLEQLIQEYQLTTKEGIILMSLAESLLRIPDADVANDVLWEKLAQGTWQPHLAHSDSLLINTLSRCLYWAQKILHQSQPCDRYWNQAMGDFLLRQGQHWTRKLINQAIHLMANQFVKGENIAQAIHHSRKESAAGYHFSYDMLGEAALSEQDAERYFFSYQDALKQLAQHYQTSPIARDDQISIKLSALSSRYDVSHVKAREVLFQRLLKLALLAKSYNIALTLDAEESWRQELSLELLQRLLQHPQLMGWGGIGVAVQAYSKRALAILCWLGQLSQLLQTRISVRLVKGAYWDSEMKWAQQKVWPDYPVFTHKRHTDVSYYACAQFLLNHPLAEYLYPQFATHNAYSIAWVYNLAQESGKAYEFQRLHGMGEAVYKWVNEHLHAPCRIYAPVGKHQALLPYLVRRLLENSANSSFVTHLYDTKVSIPQLLPDPLQLLGGDEVSFAMPQKCFSSHLRAHGNPLDFAHLWHAQWARLQRYASEQWQAFSILAGESLVTSKPTSVFNPAQNNQCVGEVHWLPEAALPVMFKIAQEARPSWSQTSFTQRQCLVHQLASLLEQHRDELIALCQKVAGKTVSDAVDEVREAIEFCYYYSAQLDRYHAVDFPSATGEENRMHYVAKGLFVCISPWNFPVAIFVGQIVAALLTGNVVIAKPAPQTSLIAYRIVQLCYQAQIPVNVLQLALIQDLALLNQLTAYPMLAGVAFTGSCASAKAIQRQLVNTHPSLPTLIAETGGQNVMIADSSALLDQLVPDVIQSAFLSAGQRCSCLRVLYLQTSILPAFMTLLRERMDMYQVGDPFENATDIGPVIDAVAYQRLLAYLAQFKSQITYQYATDKLPLNGYFVPPTVIELKQIQQLGDEQFGPILHIIPFEYAQIEHIAAQINQMGYGLTLGIHSRNQHWIDTWVQTLAVGNLYINRNMVGAVVGSQPFGGMGLSGNGLKAGGPNYLLQFMHEKHVCDNISAMGGNYQLLKQSLF